MATDAMTLINAALAAPKTHAVVTTYACGKVVQFETRSLATGENHAVGPRRNIGRELIERDDVTLELTGRTVRIVSVEVVAL